MNATHWGIGVPGALGPEVIGTLAALAEQTGYQSFWFNCVAPHADPAGLLDAALTATAAIEIGVGVIPLDGYPPATLAERLRAGFADDPRVVLGVGSGSGRRGALSRVSDGIVQLRTAVPRARIAVGAKQPRMVALATAAADALLFSMLRPDEASEGALTSYTYHRVALDPGGRDRVHGEMVSHGVWNADAGRPSDGELLGTVLPTRSGVGKLIEEDLAGYPDSWLAVLRPLPSQPSDLDEWHDLFRLLAPGQP